MHTDRTVRRPRRLQRPDLAALLLSCAVLRCAAPAVVVHSVPPEQTHHAVLAHIAAGHVGCPPDEVVVARYQVARFERTINEAAVAESWTVTCRGATFVCSAGHSRPVACTQERPPSPR